MFASKRSKSGVPACASHGNVLARGIGAFAAIGLLLTAPAFGADSIKGLVTGAGAPIAGSTVTLWAASAGAPTHLAQTRTGSDGRFALSAG